MKKIVPYKGVHHYLCYTPRFQSKLSTIIVPICRNEEDKMTGIFMIFQSNVSSMNYLKCVHYVLTIKSVNLFDCGFNKPVYR